MNKTTRTVAALLTAGLLGLSAAGAATASAWGDGHHGARCDHRAGGHGQRLHHAFKGLDLSDAQRDQLFEIRHAARPALREKMKALHKSRQTLRDLARADDYDADKVRAEAEQQAKIRADLIVMRTETMHKMMQVLTPEQKQTLTQMRQHRRHGAEQ